MIQCIQPKCKHYIAAQMRVPLLVTEDDLKEIQETNQFALDDCVTVLDRRSTHMHLFDYCSKCGARLDWRSIKSRMRVFLKKHYKSLKAKSLTIGT